MSEAIQPLNVTIPAPASSNAAFIARSAKGDVRNDAAAPPTVASNGEGHFTFADLIDVINPLQHIPGVNLAYQAITGNKISATANVAGGVLYGGPIGGLFAMASSAFTELFGASDATDNSATAKVADNNPARPDIFKLG